MMLKIKRKIILKKHCIPFPSLLTCFIKSCLFCPCNLDCWFFKYKARLQMLCVNLPAHLFNYFKAISFKRYDILAWSSGRYIIACWWLPGLFWVLLTAICICKPFRPPSSKEFKLILTQVGLFICFKYLGGCWVCFEETSKKTSVKSIQSSHWNHLWGIRWSFFQDVNQVILLKTILTLISITYCEEDQRNLSGY